MKKVLLGLRLAHVALMAFLSGTFTSGAAEAAIEAYGPLVQNADPALATFPVLADGSFSVPYTIQSANTQVLVVGLYIDAFPTGQTSTPISNLRYNSMRRRTSSITPARPWPIGPRFQALISTN